MLDPFMRRIFIGIGISVVVCALMLLAILVSMAWDALAPALGF